MRILRNIAFLLTMMTVALCLQPSFVFAQVLDSAAIAPIRPLEQDSLFNDSILQAYQDSALLAAKDTLAQDSVPAKRGGSGLEAVVNYKSSDSLVFTMGNMAYLYGSSEVTYDDINLTAERIQLSLDSSLVHANGIPDSTAPEGSKMLIGAPVFKDKSGEYETRTISYNFKTAKGYITDVVTQQGDGYVTGGITKKMADNDIFMENGRYTTCDYHDCPHFYINLTKARVRPKKNIVTGPAYLVVADVPLPIAIPFGFFPFTKSYSSGLIMPSYGADQTKGLYLREGGYYFAINDYMDLKLKGELYTKGSWGLSVGSTYAWRYKFKGSYSFSYMKTILGDKGMPDYSESTNFKATWKHSQDSRFNPNMTLSASVDFATSGFNRNNTSSLGTTAMTDNTKASSVNMSYKIPNSNWNFSLSTSITQRTKDSTLVVQLPDLSISMSRLYPFKRKVKVGAERWYEKIAMSYSGRLSNSITTKQDEFKEKSLIKDWKNGMQHNIPVSASFTVLRYINITPSFSFTDRMYTHKVNQSWDPSMLNSDGSYGGIARDTIYGMYNVYNYSTSISASTKLYGFFKPAPFFKNAKLVAVRHLFTPSISFSYNPDFSQRKYGSWDSYKKPDLNSQTGFSWEKYSPFNGQLYGTSSSGRVGAVSFSMSNNIEAKFRSDKDSTGYKKISIIDNLTTSISYNLAKDSMRWSEDLPISMVIKTGKNSSMNLSGSFETYRYGLDAYGNPRHIDRLRSIPRLRSTGYSYSIQLNNKKLAKFFGYGDDAGGDDDRPEVDINGDPIEDVDDTVDENLDPSAAKERASKNKKKKTGSSSGYDADGYLIWEIPWTFNISYSLRLGYGKDFDKKKMEYPYKLTHSASFSGTIQPTKGWNFSYNFTWDFDNREIGYMSMNCSRDMHCWNLTASLCPLGKYANFNVCIAVKSSMLSDLKYEKSSVSRSNKIDWYDD